jgi:glutaredoxin 3
MNEQVIIYSKSYCPYCKKTKSLFQSEFPHVKATIFELDQMQEGSELQSALTEVTGQRTVPNVWVKGQFIGGNDDTHNIFRSGKLKEMLSS